MQRTVLLVTFSFAVAACASGWDEIQLQQAATAGVDYGRAYKRAYAGHEDGLATMFRVTSALDGGGAEAHSGDLQKLLTMYGDARFRSVLRRESPKVRQSVIDSLDFAFLVYVRQPNWSAQFPQTYAIAPHPVLRLPRPKT
jgi:hypothetical protein